VTSHEPLVRCEDVSRTYGHGRAAVVALHGSSCIVESGDRIGLVGPSGSGKSTLLMLLAGLDGPTAGRVQWPGIGTRSELRPGPVSVVFQEPRLLQALAVLQNVSLPLVLAGVEQKAADARARQQLDELGLSDVAGKSPDELSGGQAQRVAIARALIGKPTLIFADEPTGQLDRDTAATVTEHLVSCAERLDAALVLATHDPAVARGLDIRWQIDDGRVQVQSRCSN